MAVITVPTNGSEVVAEEAGEGVPVVLLHGLTATRRYVVMGSRLLERSGHRVITYDARGHGESAPAAHPSQYTYSDLAGDLEAVVSALELDRVVLAGASMGAHTLIQFALANTSRVAGMVIITPAFAPDVELTPSIERFRRLAQGLRADGIDGFIDAYGTPRVPPQWQATVLTVIRQRLEAHHSLEALADALDQTPSSRPFERWSELSALAGIPTAVVASGDEADPDHPYAVAAGYASAIPGSQLQTEEEGKSPLAWQGAQLSRVIAELTSRSG